jgi:predicted ATPase
MITPWQVRLLGTLSAERDGETITHFRSQKTAALFAFLCVHAPQGRSHGREEIVELFWPEQDLEAGRNSLRVALSFLRRALEPPPASPGSVLVTNRTHVRLRAEAIRTDVAAFEEALARGETRPALRLYEAGPFLPGIYDEWADLERERLEALADDAREAVPPGSAHAAKFPDPALTARQYLPHNLPATTDRYFGPDQGTALEVLLLNPAVRLVTISGSGGMGKTRLAVEAASRLLLHDKLSPDKGETPFEAGIWFVSLADVSDPGELPVALALRLRAALGLAPEPRRTALDQVADTLGKRSVLIILDNLEQAADAAVTTLPLLLQRLPGATLLVTSRFRLGIRGERVFPLPSLEVPPDDAVSPGTALTSSPAMQLFIDRAHSVDTDFSVTARNAADVAALVRLLEGVPLPIELAAAWANVLTPRQMCEQLATCRNALPVRRASARTPRHHSLRAAFQWSYDLLPDDARQLLRRLSVFQGGFTPETVAAVCDTPHSTALLARLQQYSFLSSHVTPDGAAVRFSITTALREFIDEHVTPDERAALAARHAAHFAAFAEEARRRQGTPDAADALNRLDSERSNLRAAMDAVRDSPSGGEMLLRLAASQQWLWVLRGPVAEGRALLSDALALPGTRSPTTARADALNALGSMAYFQADYAAARESYQASLVISRERDHVSGKVVALSNLATICMESGALDEADALFTEALAVVRASGDRGRESVVLYNLGNLAHWREKISDAARLHEEALRIRTELRDTRGIALSRTALGILSMESGDSSDARAHFHESLRLQRDLGDRWRTADTLAQLARAEEKLGRDADAVRLRAASDSLQRALGTTRGESRQSVWDSENAALRARLGGRAFDAAWESGASLPEAEIVAQVLAS